MVLTSTHNLCFGAKIRKKVYPCKPQFYYIKVGCKGVFVTRTCFRDVDYFVRRSSSSSGCLGKAALFYCGTSFVFHITTNTDCDMFSENETNEIKSYVAILPF